MNAAQQFTPCDSAPHCVSSQAERASKRYVAPLAFSGSADSARKALLDVIESHANAKIERTDGHFIHATFRTTLGFVDDVSFLVKPKAHYIDVKSSSRIGYYDFGANRKRVETLRGEFAAALSG